MKKLIKLLALSSLVLGLASCGEAKDDDTYANEYLASGITVSIVDGGVNITTASAVLNSNKEILDIKLDSLLVPFYGMSATSKPERPASLAILDPATDDGTDTRYQFVTNAGSKLVLSKKELGSNYNMNSDETKSWKVQVERIEDYLVGKDYSTFVSKVCVTSSTCTNELSNEDDVVNGALLDFYDAATGATISLFENEHETLGISIIEMFNSNMQKVDVNESEITSDFNYELTFNNNILKVVFTNVINEGEATIKDYVEIPLKLAENSLTYADTKSYIKFDDSYSQVNKNVSKDSYELDFIKSSYEK